MEEVSPLYIANHALMRTATKDTEMHGQNIKTGDRVVIWNASANCDEAQFPDPIGSISRALPTIMSRSAMASISASAPTSRVWNYG